MSLTPVERSELRLATLSVLSAYLCWGSFGLYFKSLNEVPALEILSHRILWSLVLLAFIITFIRKWHECIEIFANIKKLSIFALSALLISINWGTYIYSVVSSQALEGSMGYFIMPLVAVILGRVFFAESFSKTQTIAIGLAFVGVAYQVLIYGQVPWIALTLAISFGFYGMLRKKAPADSIVGLFIETVLIAPLAIIAMVHWGYNDDLHFITASIDIQILLLLAGPVTALPLILFAYGTRRLRYSTVGLLQYINPTLQFFIAVFLFKEPFQMHNLVTFAFIWVALMLYSYNTLVQSRK